MRSFDSFGAFADHLVRVIPATKIALHEAVKESTKMVQKTAIEEIGVYQEEVGTLQDNIGVFPAWAPLAESTERRKERMGYPLDAPLLARGDFRDSIEQEAVGLQGVTGSDMEIGIFFELGTEKMPPRPVFGPAAVRNERKILRIMHDAVGAALIGGDWMHAPLDHEGDVER